MSDDVLIEPRQLADTSLVGIDTRERAVYLGGHLPGAVNVPDFFSYLCRRDQGGVAAMAHHFADLLGRAGVGPDDAVAVYEEAMDSGFARSCRAWFMLRLFGHRGPVRVLHGGRRAWTAEGRSLERGAVPRQPVSYAPDLNPEDIAGVEDVLAAIDDPQTVILDVRDYAEWVGASSSPYGVDFCPRRGRIPGAVWVEWYELLTRQDGISRLRPASEIRELARQRGISPDRPVIVYCFKGARAALALLALRGSGFYFNSWNEWSRDAALPIDEGYPEGDFPPPPVE